MTAPAAIFRSVLWNHAGRLAEYALMYLTSVLIARGLGVAGNGDFAALISYSQLLFVLTSVGLETSLNRHIPRLGTSVPGRASYLLRRALAVRVLAFAAAGALLLVLSASDPGLIPGELKSYLGLLLVYSLLRAIVSLIVIALTSQLRTEVTSRVNVSIRLLELLAVAALSLAELNIRTLLIVFIGTSVLHVAAYIVAARNLLAGPGEPIPFAPVLVFGGIYWLNTIVDYFLGRQGDLLMLRFLLSDPMPVSLYDVAFSLTQVTVLGATLGFSGVTFATFSRLATEGRGAGSQMYRFMVHAVSLLTIPPAAFLLFHGGSIINLLYSTPYAGAAALLQGMAAFKIAARLFGGGENAEYALSMGFVTPLVALSLFGAVVNIVLNLALIPSLGAPGSVIASGVGNIAATAGVFYLIRRGAPHRLQLSSWIRVTVACCAASWLIPVQLFSSPLISALFEAAAYGACTTIFFMILKPADMSDVELLSRISPGIGKFASRFASHNTRRTSGA